MQGNVTLLGITLLVCTYKVKPLFIACPQELNQVLCSHFTFTSPRRCLSYQSPSHRPWFCKVAIFYFRIFFCRNCQAPYSMWNSISIHRIKTLSFGQGSITWTRTTAGDSALVCKKKPSLICAQICVSMWRTSRIIFHLRDMAFQKKTGLFSPEAQVLKNHTGLWGRSWHSSGCLDNVKWKA